MCGDYLIYLTNYYKLVYNRDMKKLTYTIVFILFLTIISYPFVSHAMTVADVVQQLGLFKSKSPAVLGASASADSSSTITVTSGSATPKVTLQPEASKVIMQGLKYAAGSSMIIKSKLKSGQQDSTDSGEIKMLQLFLNAQGSDLPTTGKFAGMTKKAVKQFQIKKGLSPVGIVGPKTRQAIANEIDSASSTSITTQVNP